MTSNLDYRDSPRVPAGKLHYFLTRRAVLKWLETPSVYHIAKDELYELDYESFRFMRDCITDEGCRSKNSAFIDYCLDEGLLTTERVVIDRPVLLQSPTPSLRYLELQLTNFCNLKCNHCYLDKKSRSELSPDQVHDILTEFEEMQGLRVLISGGEPLLHSRFSEINEMLPDFFVRKVLFTNGLLLKRELLKSLKVDEIQISIDGLKAGHEAVRGAGTYAPTLDALRQALDAGFDVSVATMIHRHNLRDFDAMEQMFKELGIKDWSVDVPCIAGTLADHPDLPVSPEEGGKLLGYGFGGGLHSSGQGYGCGLHLIAVTATGKIAKCTFYEDQPAGTLDKGLIATWHAMKPVLLKDLGCKCEYLEVCRAGCRYRAETLGGKGAKDPYRCRLYDIL